MKIPSFRSAVIAVLVCVFACAMLLGCETVKGMGRDIKSADTWFKDNLW
jgi:predicted small secreted protein